MLAHYHQTFFSTTYSSTIFQTSPHIFFFMVRGFFQSVLHTHVPTKPVSFSKNGESKSFPDLVSGAVPELASGASFFVHPLLSSGHAQTAYTALHKFESVDCIHYKRRVINVEEKTYKVGTDSMPYDRWKGQSTFTIDYVVGADQNDTEHMQFCPESQKKQLPPRTEYLDPQKEQQLLDNDRPLVIALHGLSGGSYESYIRSFLNEITAEPYNFDGMVLNARGCANHTITSPQLFCGLWTNDLRYLINEHIRPRWPSKRIFLIGFSLGGSITANYLGQEGNDVYRNIKGAAIMGSPWDFPQSSYALVESFLGQKVYSPTMCQNLLRLLDQHYDGLLKSEDIVKQYKEDPSKFKLNTLRDFDDTFTSKLFGFNCASEYYRHASPDQRLLNVRVPTIIVSSKDDPIVGSKALPTSEVSLNPYTYMAVTSIGGHLGWFDYRHERWYPKPISKLFHEMSHWDVDDLPKECLPHATDGIWKHDRIVQ
ncbi:Alpha/beta hydrolase family protein [Clavispora lusitaniae]|uniref:Alpha/beta hydrolase family protein n=1 Tax=Clavispora lusitaniae TaxID=36911 RepID=UPI00202BD3C3|nr:Alpha/beta hydrolase family protein [Clavispora lusitaniae]